MEKIDTPQDVMDVCQAAIEKLINADALLAYISYEEAQAYAGTPRADMHLEICEKELTKAQEALEHKNKDGTPNPNYCKATNHSKKAWMHAQLSKKH